MVHITFGVPLTPAQLEKYQSVSPDHKHMSLKFLCPIPLQVLGPLPPSLQSLYLYGKCDPMRIHLPDSVKDLHLEGQFVDLLGRGLEMPDNLETLHVSGEFNRSFAGILPKNLKHLQIVGNYSIPFEAGTLPLSLEELNLNTSMVCYIGPGTLPPGLAVLVLSSAYNAPLGPNILPCGLRELQLGHMFNCPIAPGDLPRGLESITFDVDFNCELIVGSLPEGLRDLEFKWQSQYNWDFPAGVLPESLVAARFHRAYNGEVHFPDGLKILSLGYEYARDIVLPQGLEELRLGQMTDRTITLPPTLKQLWLPPGCRAPLEFGADLVLGQIGYPNSYEHALPEARYKDAYCPR